MTESANEKPDGVLRNRIRSTAVNPMICAIHVTIPIEKIAFARVQISPLDHQVGLELSQGVLRKGI